MSLLRLRHSVLNGISHPLMAATRSSKVAGRPFKVWSHDRAVKKSVTATSLAELTNKGKQKLGINEEEPAPRSGDLRVQILLKMIQRTSVGSSLFSNDDLETLIAMDTTQLSSLMKETDTLAKDVQDSCQRYLDDRNQATEAIDLLRLYDTARKKSPYVGEKRPRLK
ncbi:hypothetical protein ScPMuIL_007976 [Solemya velum]